MKYKIKYYQLVLKDNEYNTILTSPEKVFDILKEDFSPIQESLILIGLDIKKKIILKKVISIGGYNTILINPKDIFIHLLLSGCSSFVLAHNHPSNDVIPSNEDILFSNKILQACEIIGLQFVDNIVFSNSEFYSFKAKGLL